MPLFNMLPFSITLAVALTLTGVSSMPGTLDGHHMTARSVAADADALALRHLAARWNTRIESRSGHDPFRSQAHPQPQRRAPVATVEMMNEEALKANQPKNPLKPWKPYNPNKRQKSTLERAIKKSMKAGGLGSGCTEDERRAGTCCKKATGKKAALDPSNNHDSSRNCKQKNGPPGVQAQEIRAEEIRMEEIRMQELRQQQLRQQQMQGSQLPGTQPQGTQQLAGRQQGVQPGGIQPQVTNPQVTNPQVTNPQVTNPQVTQPQVTQPQVTQPQGTQQQATQQQGTQQLGPRQEEAEDNNVA